MPPEVSGTFFQVIGATAQEHPRMLAMVEEDEVPAETTKMAIKDRSLTLMQKGRSTRDVEERVEKAEKEVVKLAAQPPPMDPTTPQVQLKHVVSQGSEEVVPQISSNPLTKHWDTFKSVYGRDPRPVDLGILGTNHHRLP